MQTGANFSDAVDDEALTSYLISLKLNNLAFQIISKKNLNLLCNTLVLCVFFVCVCEVSNNNLHVMQDNLKCWNGVKQAAIQLRLGWVIHFKKNLFSGPTFKAETQIKQ